MNLIWFLTVGAIFSIIFGEFGKVPFGGGNISVGVTDFLVGLTILFFVIWKIGINRELSIPKSFQLLGVFWLVGGLSLLLSGNLIGGLYLVRFIFYSSFFLVGYYLINEKIVRIESLVSKIILSGVILSLFGFGQLVLVPNLSFLTLFGYDPHNNRLVSTFLDPNFTGAFLNICLILAIQNFVKLKKWKWFYFSVILFGAIVLTFSRSAILMFMVILINIGMVSNKKIFGIIIGGLLVLFLTIPELNLRIRGGLSIDRSAAERFTSWEKGMQIFKENLIFGVGFNNVKEVVVNNQLLETYQNEKVHSGAGIDSSLIFILATTGLAGLMVYISWIFLLIFALARDKLNKNFSRAMIILIIALLVNSQFINSLFYPEIMLIIFLILGASVGAKRV